jgi:hypothetical protein
MSIFASLGFGAQKDNPWGFLNKARFTAAERISGVFGGNNVRERGNLSPKAARGFPHVSA